MNEFESFMIKDVKKVKDVVDTKLNQILKNLDVLNKLNKSIIEQNQVLIGLFRKKGKKIIVSI